MGFEVRQGGLSELASLIIEISKIQWEAAVPLGFVNVNVKVNERLEVGTGRLGKASVPSEAAAPREAAVPRWG